MTLIDNDAHNHQPGDGLAQAFEHSITWEDDIWRADPVDVEAVHAKARRKFNDTLTTVLTSLRGGKPARGASAANQARILLFHGQSGAGKTHLIRALRTGAHRDERAYFGYAQMTPDVANYADYYLRRLVHSLEKPYDPDHGGESGLARLTTRIVAGVTTVSESDLTSLRDDALDDDTLARLVLKLADGIVVSPRFANCELDINIVRALLYLQRADPRIDQRIRQYLHGRHLTPLAHQAVAALDPNTGEDRAFEIIAALGQLIATVDQAALVFCIDQVEDLRFFDDAEERFQRAVRDLIQIANRVTNAIVIISVLEDFYGQVRGVLAQSYVDRIEKAGPVGLLESRTPEEARLIIARRLDHEAATRADGASYADPSAFFEPQFFEEFGGLSTRRLLEHAQIRLRSKGAEADDSPAAPDAPSWMNQLGSTLAGVLGFQASGGYDEAPHASVDFRDLWDRFHAAAEAEMPGDDRELLETLLGALDLARSEWGGAVSLRINRLELGDQLPAFDVQLQHQNGISSDTRVFICNRPTQGGGLKRQLDKVLQSMGAKPCIMLRASDFPPPAKNQTGQAMGKFRNSGGRTILVPIPEWERMLTVHQFHREHRQDAGFTGWFESAKLLSNVHVIGKLLRLETFGRPARTDAGVESAERSQTGRIVMMDGSNLEAISSTAASLHASGRTVALPVSPPTGAPDPLPANDDELPTSVLLDENPDGSSICAGRENGGRGKRITLNTSVLKRHTAVLGGSGSGKTTLALSIIEQLLQRGIPAILIDRKGDLASYANPDVWRANDQEESERRGLREKLGDAIDVAVYTPGRASGRPISITLLPSGINELPEHEQQLLANLSAAALGDMLHLKNSATHQKQSGTLSVALRILGYRSRAEVTLGDLINLLENEDPELTDHTQRMDPSGKIRRDLVAQLDSLRHRNASLFEPGGENMRMESLLGIGPYAREGRTRLSVIYTGFLGDNENILFWVAQFLSEALRFCQRNPNDTLQAVVMFDEADLYIPANAKPATAEPLQSLLKRARSAGLGLMLATQSPGDLDYKSRDQITSWFIGRVREDTALRKLKAAFQSDSGLDAAAVLPHQTVGEFHLVQEGLVRSMKAQRSLINAEQVPFDRIEQLASETKGQDERQLRLFDLR
jgi:Helicase HerA, central domain/AAA ATPase domain